MNNNDQVKRIPEIDALRGAAIILVVLGHAIQYSTISFDSNIVFRFIYSFHMPLFFIISGLCKGKILNEKCDLVHFKQHCIGSVDHLFRPYIIWTLIAVLGTIVAKKSISYEYIFASFLGSEKTLWFLWELFWCQIIISISCLIANLISKNKITNTALAIYAILSILAYVIELTAIKYSIYYLTGFFVYLVRIGKINCNSLPKKRKSIKSVLLLIIFIFLLYFALIINWYRTQSPTVLAQSGLSVIFKVIIEKVYRFIVALLGSTVLFTLTKVMIHNKYIQLFLTYYGRVSLRVYLVSTLIFIYCDAFKHPGFTLYGLNQYIVFACALLLTTALVYLLSLKKSVSKILF